jgi:hypothetical protein
MAQNWRGGCVAGRRRKIAVGFALAVLTNSFNVLHPGSHLRIAVLQYAEFWTAPV